ncbi:MADF domain [Trinorchestia longiramus]|nr:MADF domain [Trinorchestia longiramus]
METVRSSVSYPEWSKDHSRMFIRLYEKHPCLWKLKSETYKDRSAKSRAYKDIIEQMSSVVPGISVPIIKRKINTLRGQFRREVRLMLASRETALTSDELYHPKLWCYKDLLFLNEGGDDFREPLSMLSVDAYDDEAEFPVDTKEGITDQIPCTWAGFSSPYQPITQLCLLPKAASSNCSPHPSTVTTRTPSPTLDGAYRTEEFVSENTFRKPKVEEAEEDSAKIASCSSSTAMCYAGRQHDDCDDFGRVVGNKLRKMTDEQRDLTEKVIMEALFLGSRGSMTTRAHVVPDDEQDDFNSIPQRPSSNTGDRH